MTWKDGVSPHPAAPIPHNIHHTSIVILIVISIRIYIVISISIYFSNSSQCLLNHLRIPIQCCSDQLFGIFVLLSACLPLWFFSLCRIKGGACSLKQNSIAVLGSESCSVPINLQITLSADGSDGQNSAVKYGTMGEERRHS